jgi:hypothetical protein
LRIGDLFDVFKNGCWVNICSNPNFTHFATLTNEQFTHGLTTFNLFAT